MNAIPPKSKVLIVIVAAIAVFAGALFVIVPLAKNSEHKKIDNWIMVNGLNDVGDPKTTNYLGGSPLFDEATGKSTDRYVYIIERHPDKPWNN